MGEFFNFSRITIFLVSLCMSLAFFSKGEFIFSLCCALTVVLIIKSWANEIGDSFSFYENYGNETTYHTFYAPKYSAKEEKELLSDISENIKINKNFIEFIDTNNKDGTKTKTD